MRSRRQPRAVRVVTRYGRLDLLLLDELVNAAVPCLACAETGDPDAMRTVYLARLWHEVTVRPWALQPPIASLRQAIAWMEVGRANLYAAASYAADTVRHAYTIALSAAMVGFLEARGPWGKRSPYSKTLYPRPFKRATNSARPGTCWCWPACRNSLETA
jgi:hypothetical protein